jgi:hypothetical protein
MQSVPFHCLIDAQKSGIAIWIQADTMNMLEKTEPVQSSQSNITLFRLPMITEGATEKIPQFQIGL